MNRIFLGKDAAGRPLYLTPELRRQSHMHVLGSSGSGKSKFLEHLIRQDIRESNPLTVIDWHGSLVSNLMGWLAKCDIGLFGDYRRLVILDPTQTDYVTPVNFFTAKGTDISTQVSRRISATVKVWGQRDTNDMPTFERICRQIYTFAVEFGETLPNTVHLLDFNNRELREFALAMSGDSRIQAQWRWLQTIQSPREWNATVLSTENRLGRFLASKTIRRFTGLKDGTLDLMEIMDSGTILLVNLADSDYLSRDDAKLFGALFLSQFFETAMRRAAKLAPGQQAGQYLLFIDEFQQFLTEDLSAMLDQVRKGGLHLILSHQHLGHFADNPKLKKSVFTNARIRCAFGGLDYSDSCEIAEEMFLPDLNQRQIAKAIFHTIHLYREETRTAHSTSHGYGTSETYASSHGSNHGAGSSLGIGSGVGMGKGISSGVSVGAPTNSFPDSPDMGVEGWFAESQGNSEFSSNSSSEFSSSSRFSSESDSESCSKGETSFESEGEATVPVWVPIPVQELASEQTWSREEKLSKVAEILKYQPQRHCFIKLNLEKTQPLLVPFVRDHPLSPEILKEYTGEIYRTQGAIEGERADRLIAESEQRFLAQARQEDSIDDEPQAGPAVKVKRRRARPKR